MTGPRIHPEAEARAARVRLFLMDVDGVLTDGGIIVFGDGSESKRFHVRDGHGIKMLQRAGVTAGIISGRFSEPVEVRARELGIRIVRQRAHDKTAVLREVLAEAGAGPEECSYMGDDIVDLPILRAVGFAAAPADAELYVRDAVHFVSSRRGGSGAVREAIDFLLRANGSWDAVAAKYSGGVRGR